MSKGQTKTSAKGVSPPQEIEVGTRSGPHLLFLKIFVRCDGVTDCQDGADEADCQLFVASLGYDKHLVPPTIDGGPLTLNLSMVIKEITEINEIDNFFRVKFDIARTWFDKRLMFYNLKDDVKRNQVTLDDRETIWLSWLLFDNVESNDKILRTAQRDQMSIIPDNSSDFTSSDKTHLHNIHLYEGSKNAIFDVKQYSIDWLCEFNMEWYPFDTQSCTMQLLNYDIMTQFDLNTLEYTGPTKLSQHIVLDLQMCSETTNNVQKVVVEFIFGRPLFATFITTTLPTVILMVISQMATTFSDEYLDMVIQVNLTVLLVLATL